MKNILKFLSLKFTATVIFIMCFFLFFMMPLTLSSKDDMNCTIISYQDTVFTQFLCTPKEKTANENSN